MRLISINVATSVAAIVVLAALVALPPKISADGSIQDAWDDNNVIVLNVDPTGVLKLEISLGLFGVISIPVGSLEVEISLSDDDFEEKYGRPKPAKSAIIICIAILAVDAREGVEILKIKGYNNAWYSYGSWYY